MSWVARAKEAILSVRGQEATNRASKSLELIHWDRLAPLRAAVNEAFAGSPDTHPVTLVAQQAALFRQYIVVADTAIEAEELHAVIAPIAPDAKATIRSLENDYSWINQSISYRAAAGAYDAVFASLPDNCALDKKNLLAGMREFLQPAGLFWLRSRAAPLIAPSPETERLLGTILRQVPRRWRADELHKKTRIVTGTGNTTRWVDAMRGVDFTIVSRQHLGGTLLGPLLANGAILPDMAEDPEGAQLLRALYRVERMLVESGQVDPADLIVIACPGYSIADRIRESFQAQFPQLPAAAETGISGPLPEWIAFNLGEALTSARAADHAAPFPPSNLMYHTTGLKQDRDFAQHGADIITALSGASPRPLSEFTAILDFGVGVGRVARYFKGFAGRYVGADIDEPNLGWIAGNFPWVEPVLTEPAAPLPIAAASFDGVVSISVFTHIDRETTAFYVDELHRLTQSGALLFLTLHGDTALDLALANADVGRLLGIPPHRLEEARSGLAAEGFYFAEQYTHLTRTNYRYGTTFVSQQGAEAIFNRRFKVVGFVPGAIHAFQDLIVLERP